MRGRKTALVVELTDDERQQLHKLLRATTPAGLLRHAIVATQTFRHR